MKTIDTNNFDGLSIKVASPEAVRAWSFGEVTKPETINYRTGRSERYGTSVFVIRELCVRSVV
jgi:DNA-directed RNA polymerase subunit beta'